MNYVRFVASKSKPESLHLLQTGLVVTSLNKLDVVNTKRLFNEVQNKFSFLIRARSELWPSRFEYKITRIFRLFAKLFVHDMNNVEDPTGWK